MSSQWSTPAGMPSTSLYAFITDFAPAARTAASNGGRITSSSSRRPFDTGPWLRAARDAE